MVGEGCIRMRLTFWGAAPALRAFPVVLLVRRNWVRSLVSKRGILRLPHVRLRPFSAPQDEEA